MKRTIENRIKAMVIAGNDGVPETLGITVVIRNLWDGNTILQRDEITMGEPKLAQTYLRHSIELMTRLQAEVGECGGATQISRHPCADLRVFVTVVGPSTLRSKIVAQTLAASLAVELHGDLIAEASLDQLRLARPISDEEAESELLREAC